MPKPIGYGIESAACDQTGCIVVGQEPINSVESLGLTTDNGRTWSILPNPPSWAKKSITANYIACSAAQCLVYGSNVMSEAPGAPDNPQRDFEQTPDNGKTWKPIHLPGGDVAVDGVACIWSGRCWALYEGDSELESVATTTDGGSTWQPWTKVDIKVDPGDLAGFACQNDRTCYILDQSNELTATRDGGHSWRSATPPADRSGSTELSTDAITCTPAASCWIGGDDSVWIGPPRT